MKEQEKYMLCCGCGYAVKQSTMFIKEYQNTAICLCRKCEKELDEEIQKHIEKGDKR